MISAVKRILKSAPLSVAKPLRRAWGSLPDELKYGRQFREAVAFFKESELWDEQRLIAFQEERLQRLMEHVYAHVPYYRRVFLERGLTPRDIRQVDDLKKLPYLTREIVIKEKRKLLATNVSWMRREPVHTAGSTGSPLDFFYDQSTLAVNKALALRHLAWVGYKAGDSVARFREPYGLDPKRLLERDLFGRELKLTLFRADDKELRLVAQGIAKFRPTFISAWPSCLYLLARWLRRSSVKLESPKHIITSSENVYPHMRNLIEETFGAPLSDWYGQEESVAVAMQCPEAGNYHVQMEMGIVELAPRGNHFSEIVGTCLQNWVMPFIRYKTGDLARAGDGPCPCGRHHPVFTEIAGREGDFIVTPDMRLVSPLGLNHAVYHLEEIRESQIVQEDLNLLRVKVVPWEALSPATVRAVKENIRAYLRTPSMRIRAEVVEEIPRSSTGKKPFVLSRLSGGVLQSDGEAQ